jgi:Sulfotransferase family
MERAPIFVVGASRSGTNLLRALLSEHGEVWISPETHYFDDLRPRLASSGTAKLGPEERRRCEDYFLALAHRAYGQEGDPAAARVDREELRALAAELGGTGDAYFEALCVMRARLHERPRWGEKTPRHVYRITELLEAFPDAKVICLVRDPRAVIASYRDWHTAGAKEGEWNDDEALAADRERTRRSYNIVLMSYLWRGVVQASYEALRVHGPDRVHVQRFERIAAEPEAETRTLCAWLGLEYEPAMLAIPVVNSSYASSGAGVSSEPVERWRSTLSPHEVSVIQQCCGRMMDELGYAREPVRASPASLAWTWGTVPFAVVRAAALNRGRLGRMSHAVRRRAGAALRREPLLPG